MSEGGEAHARAEVGEEAEVFAQWEEGAAFGLDVGRELFPFRSADRPEEDGIRLFTGLQRFGWQRVTGGIDRRTADKVFAALDRETEFCLNGIENADGSVHDFRADAVPCENGDAVLA